MSAYISLPAREFRVPTISDVMKLNPEFVRYADGKLWYLVEWGTRIDHDPDFPGATVTEMNRFEFPVPVDDPATGGTFEPTMKAVNLIRWIRKHIEYLTEARTNAG